MARFDWPGFLKQNRIDFVTRGANVGRDHINIRCPFCGAGDPSHHMGISLKGDGYHCWRNQNHGGKSPVWLVRALLQCDEATARTIVYGNVVLVPTEDALAENIKAMRGQDRPIEEDAGPLHMPQEFKPLLSPSSMAAPFVLYMRTRGYTEDHIRWLTETYDLRYATRGKFAYRLIIPVKDRRGDLLTWTGRSIVPDEELRYKALGMPHPDARPPFAKCATKETLLGLDHLFTIRRGKTLVITEGPFDAFRIATIGRGFGVHATCIFGLSMQPGQVELIQALAPQFERITLVLDPDATMQRLRIAEKMAPLEIVAPNIPQGVKDPGDMTVAQTLQFCLQL